MKNQDGWTCDCLDFMHRHQLCKHIYTVILWKGYENEKSAKQTNIEEFDELNTCKFCNSWNIIKYGRAGRKQVYYCKDCNRRFVNNINFEKMKYDPKIISVTLDLYFRGLSLRKITDHLKQCHGLFVGHVTIYNWIDKYIGIIDEYVKTLEPKELSDVWHIDEMMVKIGGDWRWLWNALDEGTRFQLAGHISKEKYIEDARKAFQKAKNNGRHHRPKYIVTDGMHAYKRAIKKEFAPSATGVKHINNVGIKDQVNNNALERLNGTVREREKIIRGLKKEDTPILKGQRIFYNYIRPHQSLGGATPSQIAGVELNLGENKWLNLMKKSLSSSIAQ